MIFYVFSAASKAKLEKETKVKTLRRDFALKLSKFLVSNNYSPLNFLTCTNHVSCNYFKLYCFICFRILMSCKAWNYFIVICKILIENPKNNYRLKFQVFIVQSCFCFNDLKLQCISAIPMQMLQKALLQVASEIARSIMPGNHKIVRHLN